MLIDPAGIRKRKAKTPKAVTENVSTELRANCAHTLMDNEHYRLCVEVGILASNSGVESGNQAPRIIASYLSKTSDELLAIKKQAIDKIATSYNGGYTEDKSYEQLAANCAKHFDETKADAIKRWTPSKSNLNNYLKGGLNDLLTKSGFGKAYDSAKGVKGMESFAKLMSKTKPVIIDTVLAFDFDWTEFAPKEYLNLIQ